MDLQCNRLGDERSPYLLQHKDNPVWWQPWGRDAFDEARRRDVPVFLSVGYSTCHWCHVMEHESFEHRAVADALNADFVSIKVDREERPDVDAVYMDAVQALENRGGWPMSVWLTPEGKPFLGGTYFPRDHFLHLLAEIARLWRTDRARIEHVGSALTAALARAAGRERAGSLTADLLVSFANRWEREFDTVFGGRPGAPKFPPAYDLALLLRIHRRSGREPLLSMVTATLDAMARGGIFDHVGGGFHRYSTDERWLVPHFEKMLYDQAALANAYLDGWLVTGRAEYALVVRSTLDYVLRDLTSPRGGFFSAEDADSGGEEGRFYTWTESELRGLLAPPAFDLLRAAFGVTPQGNFEDGATILNLQPGHGRAGRPPALTAALETLAAARVQRVRPGLDDKVLADWNGLAIGAMARAGRVLAEPRYVDAAAAAAAFLLDRLRSGDGRLFHRWRDGDAAVPGFLDDHAFVVHGLIETYQATFDPAWLEAAADLLEVQDRLFWDEGRGDYTTAGPGNETLYLERHHPWDNVTPAGRSVAALNLLRLARLLARPDLESRSGRIFASTPSDVRIAPHAFSCLLAALDFALDDAREVAVTGSLDSRETRAMLNRLAGTYQPNMVVAAGTPGLHGVPLLKDRPAGVTAVAYVCRRGDCLPPTGDPEELVRQASVFEPLAGS